jgi:hypothetical protein
MEFGERLGQLGGLGLPRAFRTTGSSTALYLPRSRAAGRTAGAVAATLAAATWTVFAEDMFTRAVQTTVALVCAVWSYRSVNALARPVPAVVLERAGVRVGDRFVAWPHLRATLVTDDGVSLDVFEDGDLFVPVTGPLALELQRAIEYVAFPPPSSYL